jgi:hypothetical protein
MAQLVRDLGLGRAAAWNLGVCLAHTRADLERHNRTTRAPFESADLVRERSLLTKRFRALADELARLSSELDEVLPDASLTAIGQLLDAEEMARALGEKAPPYLHRDCRPAARRAAGLEHGGHLLTHFLEGVLRPLEDCDAASRANGGDGPPDPRRQVLVRSLASACSDILGIRASATASEEFVRLCVAVFLAYDLDIGGIEDLIECEMARRRSTPKRTQDESPYDGTQTRRPRRRRSA